MGQRGTGGGMGILSDDISDDHVFWRGDSGYDIDLTWVCRNQKFEPNQIVSADLVYPRGAVPNSQLIWIRVELTNGKREFLTLPLSLFHEYIKLPESSIGGWTDGDHGSDSAGHHARYALDDSGDSDETSGSVLDGAEGAAGTLET